MISKPKVIMLAFVLVAAAIPASAEIRNFQITADGKCVPSDAGSGEEPGRVTVVLQAPAGTTLSDWTLNATGTDGAARNVKFTGTNPIQATLELNGMKAGTPISAKGKASGTEVPCAAFLPAQAPLATGVVSDHPADLSKDRTAANWFASEAGAQAAQKLKQQLKTRLNLKDVELLPHLPSGSLAGPYPASIAETTDLQIVLIVDRNEPNLRALRITDVVCPERDGFRILGDLTAFVGAGQSLLAPDFALLPVGQLLECGAGQVKYTAQMHVNGEPAGESVVGQVRLRAIYQLAATAAVGFDTARPPTAYPVVDGKVSETRTRIGSALYVGFVWYPGGIDYERVTKGNRLAPFMFFDPAAIKDHFMVGAAITAKGRVSVPIGLSVHKFDIPDGTSVGAGFTGEGEVKTRKDWGQKGLGLFVGVSFNVAEFLRVKNALTPQK